MVNGEMGDDESVGLKKGQWGCELEKYFSVVWPTELVSLVKSVAISSFSGPRLAVASPQLVILMLTA